MIFESEFASFSPKRTILTKLLVNFEKIFPEINMDMKFEKWLGKSSHFRYETFWFRKFRIPKIQFNTHLRKISREIFNSRFRKIRGVIDFIFIIFYSFIRNFIQKFSKIKSEFNLLITKNGRNKGILVWKSWTWYFTTGWLFVWPYVFVS